MASESPSIVLYDINGNPLAVQNGSAVSASTPGIMVTGTDGTNVHFILTDTSSRQVVVGPGVAGTPAGGVLTIQGVTSGTAVTISGTVTANAGTGNFNNASVSTTATTPPGSATYLGGSVTTASPTYTTGQMNALSLTTAGALRIDGSAVTQPVSGTVTANQGTANTLANAWSAKITDATNGPVAVKPASTAAVATDPALVVAISPNNSLTTVSSDVTATGTLNALNAAVSITFPGKSSVGFQLSAGTLIGTIVAETSYDGGTTWNSTYFDQTAGNKVSSVVFASANTALGSTIVGTGGAGQARIRVSAFTSGTATINLRASNLADPSTLTGGTPGSAQPPLATQIAGMATTAAPTYTTNTLNPLSLTTAGALRVDTSSAHIKGTMQPLYGSSGQTITVTLASLASAGARASTAVDNTTNLYEDALLFVKITTAAAAVSTTGYVNVYGYGSVDGGTLYPEAITGTDAGVTLTSPPNLVLLAQINANTNGATKTFGPFSFCRTYGLDRLPSKWGVVVVNNTGAAFNATAGNFLVEYQGINGQIT